ncbi:MAG: YhcH/YjgK/YiaL family protein [Lachnospiraceae bacterium]|nr:YhcH/YjgK/YiaL family protein [Lachnospiraceae bacterium]
MSTITEENFPSEKVFVDGNKLFFIPVKYETKPEEKCPFEAHEIRADIHYIMKGREGVQIADVKKMKGIGVYGAEEPDYGEFEGEADGQIYINEGYFVAIYPGEAHKVSIMDGEPKPVTKILTKMEV